jgi:DhnA family fructose-bisphosphate aldolase class Ia
VRLNPDFYRNPDMNNLEYRMKEFLPDTGRHALLLDASAGLSLGALPGMEDFGNDLRPILPHLDGLVCSPGQIRRLGHRTRSDAALLVRMDWTNTLRSAAFPLPPQIATRVSILEAVDALELGANGMVLSFFLGYEEELEAACLKTTVQLALTGKEMGLPLLVEVCPSGPRVSLPGKAVELGASYTLESGADVVILPNPGTDSLKTIASMLSVPWLLKPTSVGSSADEWVVAMGLGASGLWLDHAWLDPAMPLAELAGQVHKTPEGSA